MNPLEARRRLLGRNVYKRTTEGNPAIAQGSLARRYLGITMQGWTEQAQYEGKNLFSIDDFDSNNKATIQNGTILFNQSLGAVTYNLNLGPGAYSISIKRSGYSGITIKVNEVTVIDNGGYNNYTGNFDVSDGDSVVLEFSEGRNPNGEDRMIYDIMLNSGSTALPYEPYTGGQPSPSPDYPQEIVSAGNWNEETQKWEYEVKLTGANLFDISKVITNSGLLANNGDGTLTATPGSGDSGVGGKVPRTLRDYCPELISGKTYRLSANTTGTTKRIYLSGVNNSWAYGTTRTITDADLESEVFFYASGVNSEAVISDIMITEVEDADYEPYRPPQTVTLTSDRPLTKWDRLEKRGGQWGWVYKSAEVVLDGTENYTTDSGDYVSDFSSDCYTLISNMVSDGRTNAFMNRLSNIAYSWTQTDAIGFSKNLNQLHVRISNSDLGTTGESSTSEITGAMKAYMAQQYEDGNPFIALYETAEETFAPLSESEQELMNALYTFRPTTVLSNDCGCNMTLTYKTKKSLEVTD